MADIELVIKISEEQYNTIKSNYNTFSAEMKEWGLEAIRNGTPLPKGHGRLIDADVVDDNIYDLTRSMDLNYGQISEVIENAPTIIEADKESEGRE